RYDHTKIQRLPTTLFNTTAGDEKYLVASALPVSPTVVVAEPATLKLFVLGLMLLAITQVRRLRASTSRGILVRNKKPRWTCVRVGEALLTAIYVRRVSERVEVSKMTGAAGRR